MSTSHVRADTGISCDRFIAALKDFSHRRQGFFGNSDVAGGIWQRLRYEWSQRASGLMSWTGTPSAAEGGVW